jgi:hypothetical protein
LFQSYKSPPPIRWQMVFTSLLIFKVSQYWGFLSNYDISKHITVLKIEQNIVWIFIHFSGYHWNVYKLNNTFFAFWLIIEGDTEKVLQLIMQLKSIYSKKPWFHWTKMYFWTLQRGSNKKNSVEWHYFYNENLILMTFSELPSIGLC